MGQSNVKLDISAIEKQQQVQFESELAAVELDFARKQALEKTRLRRSFRWEALGAGTLMTACFIVGLWANRRDVLVPMIAIPFVAGYRGDAVYGELRERVRNRAGRLLEESPELFVRPGGPITVAEIDRLRSRMYGST